MSGRVHPTTLTRHLRSLEVRNETRYDTRAIRKLVVACLRSLRLDVCGVVRVAYGVGEAHLGEAYLGDHIYDRRHLEDVPDKLPRLRTRQGQSMVLTLPRDPAQFSRDLFARVVLHEALHWKGVEHKDMTESQLRCTGPAPAWAEGVEVIHRDPKPEKSRAEVFAERLEHATKMIERAEARERYYAGLLLRTANVKKKWERRKRLAEREIEKAKVTP